ncbi:rRNA methyltransferase [Perkinsela sp. CCAP 1560/4]|nr:rRNA methyltransferase [Perkinsela sp. CCAP 1560/4]|eukprot:KNH05448.1 rRNA methyltransferase [Perkinsela sp. CCAP 1560/4]
MRSTAHARKPRVRHENAATNSWTHQNPAGRRKEYHNPYKLKHDKKSTHSCLDMLRGHLQGVKFRELNVQMCQKKSTENASLFGSDPKLFAEYHKGYDYQRSQWKEDPLDNIIGEIPAFRSWHEGKKRTSLTKKSTTASERGHITLETPNGPLSIGDEYFVIADLGCGTGKLAEQLMMNGSDILGEIDDSVGGEFQFKGTSVKCITREKMAVFSFDLISAQPFVTPVDISSVPLPCQSTSLVVICLAMIGSNYLDVLLESYRVLSSRGGMIVIAEVSSRLKTDKCRESFIRLLESIGFQSVHISSALGVDSLSGQTAQMDGPQDSSNDEFFLYITAVKYNDVYFPVEWKKEAVRTVKSSSPRIQQLLAKNFRKIRAKNGLSEDAEDISPLITWQRDFILRKYHPEKIVTPYHSKGRHAEIKREPWGGEGRDHGNFEGRDYRGNEGRDYRGNEGRDYRGNDHRDYISNEGRDHIDTKANDRKNTEGWDYKDTKANDRKNTEGRDAHQSSQKYPKAKRSRSPQTAEKRRRK